MNISLEKKDEVTGLLTVLIEKADYAADLEKTLKGLRQKANIPGFRKGMVPISMINKLYGTQAKADEVNKLMIKSTDDYIRNEKIKLIADVLVSPDQKKIDFDTDDEFEFKFELLIAPEFNVELSEKDSLPYYDILVDDKVIDTHVDRLSRREGKMISSDVYSEDRDLLRGALTELADHGQTKEGGIHLDEASLMPTYFTNEEQKALFKEVKTGSDVIFNVSKAFDGKDYEISSLLKIKKEDVEQHQGDFVFHVNEVSRFVPAEINQDLFDAIYGKDAVHSEEEFRFRVKSEIETAYQRDSDYKFLLDFRSYVEEKVGDIKLPVELLRMVMANKYPENVKGKAEAEEEYFNSYLKELKWDLIKNQLVSNLKVQMGEEDVMNTAKEVVKIQFAEYGMYNVDDKMVDNYAANLLKDEKQSSSIYYRTEERKLTEAVKAVANLNHKSVSIEEFNKLFESKEA